MPIFTAYHWRHIIIIDRHTNTHTQVYKVRANARHDQMNFEYHRFAIHMRLICFMCLLDVVNLFADNMFCVNGFGCLLFIARCLCFCHSIQFILISRRFASVYVCVLSFFLYIYAFSFYFFSSSFVMRRNFFRDMQQYLVKSIYVCDDIWPY